jgi:predicted enzyme related to lactoylglutathione lyase
MDPQSFIWHELMSRDPEASEGFYEKVIGVEVQPVADAPGDYRLLLVDGRPFAGMTGPRADSATWPSGGPEGHWVPYFGTDDVEAAVGRATSGAGPSWSSRSTSPAGAGQRCFGIRTGPPSGSTDPRDRGAVGRSGRRGSWLASVIKRSDQVTEVRLRAARRSRTGRGHDEKAED